MGVNFVTFRHDVSPGRTTVSGQNGNGTGKAGRGKSTPLAAKCTIWRIRTQLRQDDGLAPSSLSHLGVALPGKGRKRETAPRLPMTGYIIRECRKAKAEFVGEL
jgi:hypothetical protein